MYWVLIAAAVVCVLAVCLLIRSALVEESGLSPRRATIASTAVFAVIIAVFTAMHAVRPAVGLPVEGRIDAAVILLICMVIWLGICAVGWYRSRLRRTVPPGG